MMHTIYIKTVVVQLPRKTNLFNVASLREANEEFYYQTRPLSPINEYLNKFLFSQLSGFPRRSFSGNDFNNY